MAAIGKTGLKRYSKSNTDKKLKSSQKEVGDVKAKGRKFRGEEYAKDSFLFGRVKKGTKSKKKSKQTFGAAFKDARAGGKKTFIWNGNPYHTKTKEEMEAKVKETAQAPKDSKTYIMKQRTGMLVSSSPKKKSDDKKSLVSKSGEKVKSFRKKVTGYETQPAWEDAKSKRKIQKRIDSMKKRKNQGKTFSASNLSDLEKQIASM